MIVIILSLMKIDIQTFQTYLRRDEYLRWQREKEMRVVDWIE